MDDLTVEDIQAILDGNEDNPFTQQYAFYPLTSPGMSLPGPNFCAHAAALSGETPMSVAGTGHDKHMTHANLCLTGLYLRCLYSSDFSIPVEYKGERHMVRVIPGHRWGGAPNGPLQLRDDEEICGVPRESQPPVVMIIGKHPGLDEIRSGRNLCGPSGDLLHQALLAAGMSAAEIANCYVCNLVRWQNLNPQGGSLPQAWIKDCRPLLDQEFRLVRPDYVLCLGAEATKAVCGRQNNVRNMIGRSVDISVPINEAGEPALLHHMTAMAVVHPAAVLRTTELHSQFAATLQDFVQLVHGSSPVDREAGITIQVMTKLRELRQYVDLVLSQPGLKKIAADCEWEGSHPGEPGAYLRTVQLSHNGQHAAVVKLRNQGGESAFAPDIAAAMAEIGRLLNHPEVQILGSFFASDIPWLLHAGVDVRHKFIMPAQVDAIEGGNYPGGFDIALGMHAYNETGDLKLEIMATRYCGAGRWDMPIMQWRKAYCSEHGIADKDLSGYGECPDDILLPYGGYDAAYTWQVGEVVKTLLANDRFGNASWTAFHRSMMAFPAFCEMGIVGVKVDPERIDGLTDLYLRVRESKLAALRQAIHWPEFNPRSAQQCVDLLFGEAYSTKRDAAGNRIRVRPAGATSLYLSPVKSTGQRGAPWARVVQAGEEHKYTPSTDKETLGILGLYNETALHLRDVRLIDQILKSVLRPPVYAEDGHPVLDAAGRRAYAGGMGSYICSDCRVRSAFLQTMETGRASSARPPLQNLSKRRERDYKRILGEDYQWKIRSFLTSNVDPDYGEPTVLVEADLKGAELFAIAVLARDENMIDHCNRANLPDDHPDKYDIHSNVCVRAFNLNCEPTQAALAEIGQEGLRVGAKNVIFGVNYGRTAEAIARQCQEEGVALAVDEAQTIIDGIFEIYPNIPHLQEQLRARVSNPGWIRTYFGRYRRFIPTTDRAAMGELERQALNFPIQSLVADAISTALYHLYTHPRRAELGYRIVLQIHDAVLLEVPVGSLNAVVDEILPDCMVNRVSFKSCDLNGVPYAGSPEYRFGIDVATCLRWGEKLTWNDCDMVGIDRKYGVDPAA